MVKINTEKLNSRSFKIIFRLVPFAVLLSGSFNYLAGIIFGGGSTNEKLSATVIHLLFILALSAVLSNILIETLLSLFERSSKSCLFEILYGGRRFFPLRSYVFVAAFIIAYIFLSANSNQSALYMLISVLPPAAIAFNAPRFLSRRIRRINGSYIIYSGHFRTVFSYYTDESGNFCVILNDGKKADTGVNVTEIDFQKLEAEFKNSNLKTGG